MDAMIEVHVIKRDEKTLVFMPEEKVFCEVSEDIGQALLQYEKKEKELDEEQLNLIHYFIDNVKDVPKAHKIFNTTLASITMLLTNCCNLKCTYCYADEGSYQREQTLMSLDTAKLGVQKLLNIHKGIRKIRFFGGEPLLNFPVLKGVCEYITDELGIEDMIYCVETNGTLMNEEMLEILRKYHVNINISYDGPQDLHDAHRISQQGKGTHKEVVKTMELLKKHNVQFSIQCTYTDEHKTISYSKLFNELSKYTPYVRIASCLLKNGSNTNMNYNDYVFEPLNYLLESEPKVYNLMTIQYFSSLLNIKNDLECCGAHHKITIFPDGSIYPCELVAGNEYCMGNVHDDDFPGAKFNSVKKKLEVFNRDLILGEYWFRYLINPCCVADILDKEYQEGENLRISPNTEEFYEDIIMRVYEIYNNGKWDIFTKNTSKYYNDMRVRA